VLYQLYIEGIEYTAWHLVLHVSPSQASTEALLFFILAAVFG